MITAISRCPQVDLVAVETGVESVAEVGLCFHLLHCPFYCRRSARPNGPRYPTSSITG
jgi:hypothetical protein